MAELGLCSRREADEWIARGWVRVDGQPARMGMQVGEQARIEVDPRARGEQQQQVTILLHKPVGYTCSTRDAGRLIYDLLPPRFRYRDPLLSSVGRLDRDTSGLLLMTDDGGLLHRIISPKSSIPKCYEAQLAQDLRGDEAALFASGTLLLESEKTPLLPAQLSVLEPRRARLVLHEGRYHQVKRMFGHFDNKVVGLHRERMGCIGLDPALAPGEYRELTAEEIASV